MKRLLLMSILISSTFNVLAQVKDELSKPTDKGNFIVDGSVYFSINNSKSEQGDFYTENNSFGFGISPKTAYFVVDRLALGLETSFIYSDNESMNSDGSKSTSNTKSLSFGPFFRYYLANGFFGEASVAFGTGKSNSEGSKSKADVFRYQLGLGYAFFLNSQISLEPLISYRYNRITRDYSNSISTNKGFTLGAGFTIYL